MHRSAHASVDMHEWAIVIATPNYTLMSLSTWSFGVSRFTQEPEYAHQKSTQLLGDCDGRSPSMWKRRNSDGEFGHRPCLKNGDGEVWNIPTTKRRNLTIGQFSVIKWTALAILDTLTSQPPKKSDVLQRLKTTENKTDTTDNIMFELSCVLLLAKAVFSEFRETTLKAEKENTQKTKLPLRARARFAIPRASSSLYVFSTRCCVSCGSQVRWLVSHSCLKTVTSKWSHRDEHFLRDPEESVGSSWCPTHGKIEISTRTSTLPAANSALISPLTQETLHTVHHHKAILFRVRESMIDIGERSTRDGARPFRPPMSQRILWFVCFRWWDGEKSTTNTESE